MTLNLHPWSPSCPWSPPWQEPPSITLQPRPPPASPSAALGCAEPKGSPSRTCAALPAQCWPHCHWPRADLGSPQPQGLLGCSSWPLEGPRSSPTPSAATGTGQSLTDHMLHTFCPTFSPWCCMVTIWERAVHGQEFGLDTGSLSVRGREKSNFRNSCGCIYYLDVGMLRN